MSSNSFSFSFQENQVQLNCQNFIPQPELTIKEENVIGEPYN